MDDLAEQLRRRIDLYRDYLCHGVNAELAHQYLDSLASDEADLAKIAGNSELIRHYIAENGGDSKVDPAFLRSRAAAYRTESALAKDLKRVKLFLELGEAFDAEADAIVARRGDNAR